MKNRRWFAWGLSLQYHTKTNFRLCCRIRQTRLKPSVFHRSAAVFWMKAFFYLCSCCTYDCLLVLFQPLSILRRKLRMTHLSSQNKSAKQKKRPSYNMWVKKQIYSLTSGGSKMCKTSLLELISIPTSATFVPALCLFTEQTGPPVYVVLCPDWIKWAGIPENVFSLLLHEEQRHAWLNKHSSTVITDGTLRYLTFILIYLIYLLYPH